MTENRQIGRENLFFMADLRHEGIGEDERIRVRNLSARGLMGESTMPIATGENLSVNLRNIGWVRGSVAWVQDNRFGLAFDDEIDAAQVHEA